MPSLNTFIQQDFRPEITGSMLDDAHQTCFPLKSTPTKRTVYLHAICFGPKQDKVLVNLEHAIFQEDKLLILYYEDLHKRWHYVQNHQESYFIYQKNQTETLILKPHCLYIRGCYVEPNSSMWRVLGEFLSFTDNWPGKILCAPRKQCNNESKLYQLHTTLRAAAKQVPSISIGKSYVVKGHDIYHEKIAHKNYIVKSLSSVRSIVVDETKHHAWNTKNLDHLPTLFQEKQEGPDVRLHIVHNKSFGKLAAAKEDIDYRYDKNFFNLEDIKPVPHALHAFACDVSTLEENTLMGIDFIKTTSGYVVLEANPSPGWSAYHESDGIETNPFIKALIEHLKT